MLIPSPHMSVLTFAVFCFVSFPASALLFTWTPENTNIIVNADSLELTVDGITVTAQAFTAEINAAGDDAVVVGPWPTQSAADTPGFGVDVRGLGSEQLGLIADPSADNSADGTDYFPGGLSPGFSSGYGYDPLVYGGAGYGYDPALWDLVVSPAPNAFHFAVFSFSQPLDIPGVTVDDVTNQDRDIWMGTGTEAPDFSSGFLAGISGFDIFNSPDDMGDGLFTHSLPELATGISYFIVGAPPQGPDFGPITGTGELLGSNFFIDSFNGTPSDDQGPGPSPVPAPGTVWLLLVGMLAMGRQRFS